MYITKKYLDITDIDRSESNYCISGRYNEIDQTKISFEDWVKKSLDFDLDVDMTYWKFDRKIEGELANKLRRENNKFKQKYYIITNRRIVHVFDNSKKFHQGFHTKPESIMDFLRGIYNPSRVRHFPQMGKSSEGYMLRNNRNNVKSYLNIHDKKMLKIQTSFLNEESEYIININEILSSDVSLFDESPVLNESDNSLIRDKYKSISKWIYTLDPNSEVRANKNGLILEDHQLIHVLKNIEVINEVFDCNYHLDNNILTIGLR